MAANVALPPGFVLDEQAQKSNLPEGFMLDAEQPKQSEIKPKENRRATDITGYAPIDDLLSHIGKSAYGALSMPGDAAIGIGNQLNRGLNKLFGKEIFPDIPVNTSEALNMTGVVPQTESPEGHGIAYNTAMTGADLLGQSILPLGGAKAAGQAMSNLDRAKSLIPMAGMAAGGGIAKTIAPDDAAVDIAGQLLGGGATAAASKLLGNAQKASEFMYRKALDSSGTAGAKPTFISFPSK